MDRAKAKRLLNKKSWTGKEVGQAYLYSLSEQTKAGKAKKTFNPPFSREELNFMEQSITIQEQYIVFKAYANLYSALVDTSNMAEAQIQQTYSGFYRYLYTLKDCIQADDVLKAVQKYPLIMTSRQYERLTKEIIEIRMACRNCLYSTIIEYIEDLAKNLDKAPDEIKMAIEDTKKQACTNKRILANYSKDMGAGYYTLPDGTRSDRVTSEQWNQKIKENFLSTHKLTVSGKEASPEDAFSYFTHDRLLQLEKLLFEGVEGIKKACKTKSIDLESKGLTAEEILEYIQKRVEGKSSRNPDKGLKDIFNKLIDNCSIETTWHTEKEVPELSKYDVLSEERLMHRYKGVLIGDAGIEQQKAEFIEDYPELYRAVEKELKKHLPVVEKLKEKDYLKPTLTFGQIKKSGLTMYDYLLNIESKDILDYYCKEDNTANMQKRLRFMYSGIAIIKEDTIDPSQIAENGDYIERQSNPYLMIESIDRITNDENRVEELEQYREYLIKPALKYIYAYNALIDAIADVYDVGFIDILKKDMSLLHDQLEGFNGMLYGFYNDVFGTEEEKERKRKLIKQVFFPIHTKEFQPQKEKVQEVKNILASTYGKVNALGLVKDLHLLVLEILGQGDGT